MPPNHRVETYNLKKSEPVSSARGIIQKPSRSFTANERERPKHVKHEPPLHSFNQSITSYENMRTLTLTKPIEVKQVITHRLDVVSEDYRLLGKLTSYTDSDGKSYPLNTWSEIVRRTNYCMKSCVNGKMIKTYFLDDTNQPAPTPNGLHIFAVPREITEYLIQGALQDADNLYWNPRHRSNRFLHMIKPWPEPACNMLFYPGCSEKNPSIKDVFKFLFAEAPCLAKYALIYLTIMRDILGLDHDEMESVSLCLNHYDPNAAINPHIDTVFTFNGTLGPIFTVAMGPSEKLIDLLPVLLPDSNMPVRVFSKPNELMMMDGEARTLWAHSKPWNYPHEQYTLVYKCPEFRTKKHDIPFEYEGNRLGIPCHYVSQL